MKTTTTHRVIAAALISLASLAAHAAPLSSYASTPAALLGASATQEVATRVIALTPGTSYVNVVYGDVVRFDTGAQSFTIKFDGVRQAFDLNALAPAGALNRTVKVYVSPVQDYMN